MKKRLKILLCSLWFLTLGGCELFNIPLQLATELLPIAIKYAPYALMFLEAPSENPQEIEAAWIQDKEMALPQMLKETLEKRPRDMYVVAIYLKSENTEQEIRDWLKEHPQFKGRYVATFCDLSNDLHYRQIKAILEEYEVPFAATGPLQSLSTVSCEERGVLLAGLQDSR